MRKTTHARYLQRHSVAARILEAIPCDGWISAAEIAAAVGLTPNQVSGMIRFRLFGVYVERRRASLCSQRHYLYRRLPRVAAPAGPRTSGWVLATGDTVGSDGSPVTYSGHQPAGSQIMENWTIFRGPSSPDP